jgi:hypothetical protein
VVAALAVGLCLGGVAITYVLYDKATTPDRSSPTVTLVQYLNARFGDHDDAKARGFECKSPNLAELDQLSGDLRYREKTFGVATEVASAEPRETVNGDNAGITAYLKVTVREPTGQASRSVQSWQFSLVRQGGWRLCGAHHLS